MFKSKQRSKQVTTGRVQSSKQAIRLAATKPFRPISMSSPYENRTGLIGAFRESPRDCARNSSQHSGRNRSGGAGFARRISIATLVIFTLQSLPLAGLGTSHFVATASAESTPLTSQVDLSTRKPPTNDKKMSCADICEMTMGKRPHEDAASTGSWGTNDHDSDGNVTHGRDEGSHVGGYDGPVEANSLPFSLKVGTNDVSGPPTSASWSRTDEDTCDELGFGFNKTKPPKQMTELVAGCKANVDQATLDRLKDFAATQKTSPCEVVQSALVRCSLVGGQQLGNCKALTSTEKSNAGQWLLVGIDGAAALTCGVACGMGIGDATGGTEDGMIGGDGKSGSGGSVTAALSACEFAVCGAGLAHIGVELYTRVNSDTNGTDPGLLSLMGGAGILGVGTWQSLQSGGICGIGADEGVKTPGKGAQNDFYPKYKRQDIFDFDRSLAWRLVLPILVAKEIAFEKTAAAQTSGEICNAETDKIAAEAACKLKNPSDPIYIECNNRRTNNIVKCQNISGLPLEPPAKTAAQIQAELGKLKEQQAQADKCVDPSGGKGSCTPFFPEGKRPDKPTKAQIEAAIQKAKKTQTAAEGGIKSGETDLAAAKGAELDQLKAKSKQEGIEQARKEAADAASAPDKARQTKIDEAEGTFESTKDTADPQAFARNKKTALDAIDARTAADLSKPQANGKSVVQEVSEARLALNKCKAFPPANNEACGNEKTALDEAEQKKNGIIEGAKAEKDGLNKEMSQDQKSRRHQRTAAACAAFALFTVLAFVRAANIKVNKKSNQGTCDNIERLWGEGGATLPDGSPSPGPGPYSGFDGTGSLGNAGGGGSMTQKAPGQTGGGGAKDPATGGGGEASTDPIATGTGAATAMNNSIDGQAFQRSGLSKVLPPGVDPYSLAKAAQHSSPGKVISGAMAQMGGPVGAELAAFATGLENSPKILNGFGSSLSGGQSSYSSPSSSRASSPAKSEGGFLSSVSNLFGFGGDKSGARAPAQLDFNSRPGLNDGSDVYHTGTRQSIFEIVSDKYNRVDNRVR